MRTKKLPCCIMRYNECCGNVWLTPDEGPSLETSKFSLCFSGSCIPTNESLFILLTLPTLVQTVQYEVQYYVWYMFAEVNWEIAPYSCFTWELQYITFSRIKSYKAQRYINITQRNKPKNIDLIMVIYIGYKIPSKTVGALILGTRQMIWPFSCTQCDTLAAW
jgi:hypothetical protein